MKRIPRFLPLRIAAIPATASAQGLDRGAYDRCLLQTAVAVSYEDVPADAIFALARRRCALVRDAMIRDGRIPAALDASDASKAAAFPDWMSALRERRRLRAIASPIPADPGYR